MSQEMEVLGCLGAQIKGRYQIFYLCSKKEDDCDFQIIQKIPFSVASTDILV